MRRVNFGEGLAGHVVGVQCASRHHNAGGHHGSIDSVVGIADDFFSTRRHVGHLHCCLELCDGHGAVKLDKAHREPVELMVGIVGFASGDVGELDEARPESVIPVADLLNCAPCIFGTSLEHLDTVLEQLHRRTDVVLHFDILGLSLPH